MAYSMVDACADAVSELKDATTMWNPFQLIYQQQADGSVVNQYAAFIHSMQLVGLALLVLMAALKFIKIFLDELNAIPATTTILGIAVELIFVSVFLFNYTWFAEIFPSLFHSMTRAIQDAYETSLMDQVIAALKAAGGEKATEIKWFSLNALMASVPNILSALAAALSLALFWVLSKCQALFYTFWYLVGPILIPFYLFPPFRGVAERWFASLLGASFMGVVGSLMYMLLVNAQWMLSTFASGTNGGFITALVFAILTLILMISIPRLSSSIWEGISSSFTRGAAMAGRVGGATVSAAVGGAGAVGIAAGSSLRTATGMAGVLHRYSSQRNTEMPMGKRILDAVRNRDSFASSSEDPSKALRALSAVHKAGGMAKDLGFDLVLSQMPSAVQRAESRLGRRKTTRAREREREAVRGVVAAAVGAEAAKGMPFSDTWRLPQRAGETFEAATQRCAEGFIRTRKLEDQAAAVQKEAARILGPERAHEFHLPENFRLKTKRGTSDADAVSTAAIGLLKSQKLLDAQKTQELEQKAIMAECIRMVGAEKAQTIQMPGNWGVQKRKGQTWKEAMHGAAVTLLQRNNLIDKKEENEIALRYRYALARKRKQEKATGGTTDKKTPKGRKSK